jgi:site-specific DNA-cytosine methylase
MTLKYIELCAGAGGMRAGLETVNWECLLAVDKDPDAVAVHRLAHGSALQADVTTLTPNDLPSADVWLAGFPCQPFSSSGNRLGFGHHSGNVFDSLVVLLQEKLPPIVVLENVEGLLSNKSGHTFAAILRKLTALGYQVDWMVLDLRWFGPPQTRPRLFIIGALPNILNRQPLPSISTYLPGLVENELHAFTPLVESIDGAWSRRTQGSLSELEGRLRPSVGKARPVGQLPFGGLGRASGDHYVSLDLVVSHDPKPSPALASIVAPSLHAGESIRSGRFWTSNGGPTKLHLRGEAISHCVGTSLGGAPLFAVPLSVVSKTIERNAFLQHSNWHREQDGLLVMRLRPDRALLLFGPYISPLQEALDRWDVGETRKYLVVGNLVAPVCARIVAELISAQLSEEYAVAC